MTTSIELLQKVFDYYHEKGEYDFSSLPEKERLYKIGDAWDFLIRDIETFLNSNSTDSDYILVSKAQYKFFENLSEIVQDVLCNFFLYSSLEKEIFTYLISTEKIDHQVLAKKFKYLELPSKKLQTSLEKILNLLSECVKDESL